MDAMNALETPMGVSSHERCESAYVFTIVVTARVISASAMKDNTQCKPYRKEEIFTSRPHSCASSNAIKHTIIFHTRIAGRFTILLATFVREDELISLTMETSASGRLVSHTAVNCLQETSCETKISSEAHLHCGAHVCNEVRICSVAMNHNSTMTTLCTMDLIENLEACICCEALSQKDNLSD